MTYSRPPKGKRHSEPNSDVGPQLMIAVSLVILFLCGLGYAIYEIKAHPGVGNSFSSYTSRFRQWALDRKVQLGQGLASVKSVAQAKDNSEPVVQFEFYNKLPAMQMMQADAEKQIEKAIATKVAVVALEPKPQVVAKVAKKLAATKPVSAASGKKAALAMHESGSRCKVVKPKHARKKIARKKTTNRKVAHHKRSAKRHLASKKAVKIVVSRADDLERDLLATIKNTAGGK